MGSHLSSGCPVALGWRSGVNDGGELRGGIIRVVLVSLLSGLSIGLGWTGVLYSSANPGEHVAETTVPDIGAILLLGLALLSMANLLRRQTRKETVELSVKSAASPMPQAIGRELCPESSVRA
jgi:hypothetical protein